MSMETTTIKLQRRNVMSKKSDKLTDELYDTLDCKPAKKKAVDTPSPEEARMSVIDRIVKLNS